MYPRGLTVSLGCSGQVQITVADGSVIRGTISGGSLLLKTAFGELAIEGPRIQTLSGSTLKLDDGSIVQGTIRGGQLRIAGSLGSLDFPGEKIRSIEQIQRPASTGAASTPSRSATEAQPKVAAGAPKQTVALAPEIYKNGMGDVIEILTDKEFMATNQ